MQIKMVVVIGKLLRRSQGCAAEYQLTIINYSLQPFSTVFTLDVLFLSLCDRQKSVKSSHIDEYNFSLDKLNNNTTIFI